MRNRMPMSDPQNPEKCNSYSKRYQTKKTKNECVYCEKPDYGSSDCKTEKTVAERRKILNRFKNRF